ncbi:hypothetical protein DEU56DRAFT_831930 [Suillus clintonianus]|uniref:uncharacterized protein n=1 Tax=Suillus clintonianus TaxID=1904413 RepID=UPI001B86061F|nr:uncharacterized protein DEU56DRAFT_831930 [Suillus clintonianus]KAG2122473.1 hypothetical protein DEU56DRAFT_831930 [Suillus clintonianus]
MTLTTVPLSLMSLSSLIIHVYRAEWPSKLTTTTWKYICGQWPSPIPSTSSLPLKLHLHISLPPSSPTAHSTHH